MESKGGCVLHAQSGLLPDAVVGGGTGPGCFTHLKGIATTTGQLWWWEAIMTFLLVSVSAILLTLSSGVVLPEVINKSCIVDAIIHAMLCLTSTEMRHECPAPFCRWSLLQQSPSQATATSHPWRLASPSLPQHLWVRATPPQKARLHSTHVACLSSCCMVPYTNVSQAWFY